MQQMRTLKFSEAADFFLVTCLICGLQGPERRRPSKAWSQAFLLFRITVFLSCFFSFFFFFMDAPVVHGRSQAGGQSELPWWPMPQLQQCQTWAASLTYTTAWGDAGSWARPGIEHIHTHTHTYIPMYVYLYTPIYIYTYIYLYIYLYIYTHTYIGIHIYLSLWTLCWAFNPRSHNGTSPSFFLLPST